MKVLFLDVDGVLNCRTTEERFMGFLGIDPELVKLVDKIVDKTGCKVVLSSSWRLWEPHKQHVADHIEFIDVTLDNKGLTDRGCEIQKWLEENPVDNYAILDDNGDFHKDQHLFRTVILTGLTGEVANRVIEHLNQK